MNHTIDYYNQNAENFINSTLHADMHLAQDKFLSLLEANSFILDFGCGSGRDTKYFLDRGYRVTAVDGSEELCKKASQYTGIAVKHLFFQDLDEVGRYDGIWACASILHLPGDELLPVFRKMCAALREHGVIYASFKYGLFEGSRKGRYFTDFTEETFGEYIKQVPELMVLEQWITSDVRPGREEEKWLNLLLGKKEKGND